MRVNVGATRKAPWHGSGRGRRGRGSRRRAGRDGWRTSASERGRSEQAETMAPSHGGVRIVRAPPRAQAAWNFGGALKKKISLWFDATARARHSQREDFFFPPSAKILRKSQPAVQRSIPSRAGRVSFIFAF